MSNNMPDWDDMPEPIDVVRVYWQDIWYALNKQIDGKITKDMVKNIMEHHAGDLNDQFWDDGNPIDRMVESALTYCDDCHKYEE